MNSFFKLKNTSFFLVVLVVIAAIVATVIWHRNQLLYHYKEVQHGVLYRSGTLSYSGLKLAHNLSGFKTIVDLRSHKEINENKHNWYGQEQHFAKKHHVKLVDLYILPSVPPTKAQMKRFLKIMTTPEDLPVLVHCQYGVIRTGMMVAAYKIKVLNQPTEQVFKNLPMFGHHWHRQVLAKRFILSLKPNA